MIKILDSAMNRLGVIKKALEAKRLEAINGENTLDFKAVFDDKLSLLVDENSIYELNDDYFETAFFEKTLNEDNTQTINVEAQHVSYRLNNPEYNLETFTETGAPLYILGKILEGTDFTAGTVEQTDIVTYSAQEAKSRRQLLMEFVAYIGGEVEFHQYSISIVMHRGATTGKPAIKDRNVKIISKTVNKREFDKFGNHLVAYKCEPVYLPGDTYELGDSIILIQRSLGIQEVLRVVEISQNPYDIMDATLTFANYENALTDNLYRIETSAVAKDKLYNGTRIGPEYGFENIRSDKKARSYFRSDGMAFQTGDGTGENWVDRLYFVTDPDTGEVRLVIDGDFSASTIEALKAQIDVVISNVTITNTLAAEKGYIAELTVDQLDTSTKVKNFLDSSTADVNYIKIANQTIDFITASTDGSATEQASDRYGNPIYWVDAEHTAITTEQNDLPVYIYTYSELVKMSWTFYEDGEYIPKITLGAGTGTGDNGKGYIYKGTDGLYIEYKHSQTGESRIIKLTDDGIDLTEYESIKVSETVTITGVPQIWVQPAQPTTAKAKDVWIDTDDYSRYDKTALTGATTLKESDNEVITASGTFTVSLHAATTAGIIKKIYNIGDGLVTLAGTINGKTNMLLYPGEGVELVTDGSGWRT